MTISKASARSSYAIEVIPGVDEDASSVLIARDPEPNVSITSCAPLVDLYGLTPSEARLLAQLLQGRTLRESALALRISWESSRTYMKRILAKTRTRRQAELLALAVRLGPSR